MPATTRALLLLGVMALAVQAMPVFDLLEQQYQNFKMTHNKRYNPDEDSARFQIFLNNRQQIADHNERYAKGEVNYKLGITKFADMTPEEMQMSLGLKPTNMKEAIVETTPTPTGDDGLPDHVDWREKGAVTPVKDQGQCGSCWAFSTTGALEGQYFMKTGKLKSFSEQELVECSDENSGCNGGLPSLAYAYIELVGGLADEKDYRPYSAKDNVTCTWDAPIDGDDHGYMAFRKGDEQDLKRAIAKYGPISVAFSALPDLFDYHSGVYHCPSWNTENMNHAVLAVGYGTDPKQGDYFIVKNSWGTGWGDEGYFKIARNYNNTCHIASMTSIPLVWKSGE